MERKKLLDKLQGFSKHLEVFVWDVSTQEYINEFHVWEEGHDHRHFIDLDKLHNEEYLHLNKRYTVGELINDLKQTYKKYSKEYSDTITVNVNNRKNENTSNFDMVYKNGKLYFVGKEPNWKKFYRE